MQTFSQTRATLLEILEQLKRLEGPGEITRAMRVIKEREAGKLCYQAEEDLSPLEFSLLRDALNVRGNRWDNYKHACLDGLCP